VLSILGIDVKIKPFKGSCIPDTKYQILDTKPMISYYKRTIRDNKIKEITEPSHGSWISVINPTDEEIKKLVETHNLDEFNVRGGLDEFELPRIEEEEGVHYVYVNIMPPKFERDLNTLLIILTENNIITISKIEPRFYKKIMNGEMKMVTTQKLKSLISILSLVNREFEKVTRRIVKSVQGERNLVDALDEKHVSDLLQYEDVLNTFVTSYHYMNLVYERMMRRLNFFEDDEDLIEDLIIEGKQGADMCRSSLKTISNIRNYTLVLSSNRLNKILKVLTIATIFISIPAAISGLYGMNVALPFQDNPLSFAYIIAFLLLIWLSVYLYFKRSKIL